MNLERKPYRSREDFRRVDFAQIRVEILNFMEDGEKTTDEIIKALLPRWTRNATHRAIRYLREDKYISRENNRLPWKRIV